MPTSLRGDRIVKRLCRNAVMLALAMIFSFVEHLVPLGALLPLPGVKLGLANVVITALLFFGSPVDALLVSLCRIGLSALLFGNTASFFFSLLGGVLAYLLSLICYLFCRRFFSFIGVSVLSATGHHIGQMIAAVLLFDSGAMLTYLPVLLPAGILMGTLSGWVLNLCEPQLKKLFERGGNH